MDPASRNWLQRLAHYFDETFRHNNGVLMAFYESERDFDTFIFRLLHTSGLLFGHPHTTCFVKLHEMPEWTETDRAKVVLAETLFHAYIFTHKHNLKDCDSIEPLLSKAVEVMQQFYLESYPELKDGKWQIKFIKSKNPIFESVEAFINKRSFNATILDKKYWLNAAFNTFLFLDLVYFASWLTAFDKHLSVWYEHIQVQMLIIMAAAMHSDSAIEDPEKTMYHYFLSGSELSEATRRSLERLLKQEIKISELGLELVPHPLFYRIYLEMGIIASLADNNIISEQEISFISELSFKLGLNNEQKDECIFITESFFVAHQKSLIYLRCKDTFDILNKNLQRRMRGLVKKNQARIMREMFESKELVELLIKSQRTQLTSEEKEKVKEQLTDVLRTIPSLAIFMIPGGSLLLPILLKILPDELLKPSSFRN